MRLHIKITPKDDKRLDQNTEDAIVKAIEKKLASNDYDVQVTKVLDPSAIPNRNDIWKS